MFDTPDLGPLFVAPEVAIWSAGVLSIVGLAVGLMIEKVAGKRPAWYGPLIVVLVLVSVPFTCFASVALEIGVRDPALWFKPTTEDIVAKWTLLPHLTDAYQNSGQGSLPAKELVFYKDGTFQANGIPDMWSYYDISNLKHVAYISGSGTWYLGQTQGTQRLEWTIFTEFREIGGQAAHRTMRYYFQGHLPPYKLGTLDSGYWRFWFESKSYLPFISYALRIAAQTHVPLALVEADPARGSFRQLANARPLR